MTHYFVKRLYTLLLIFGSALSVNAQRNCEKGDRYFYQNQFEEAIRYYQLDIKSKNRKSSEKAMQKLADCYRITGEFEKAEETYKKILKRKKKDPVNYLNYGLSLKSSAKYAEAITQFNEYILLKPEDPMGKIYLQSCDSAQKWLDETIGKEVKNLEKINTELSEFSPVFYSKDKMYFTSSRDGSKKALISFDGGGEVHRLDLYGINISSIENSENEQKDIVNIKDVNTPLHEGSACFSDDNREMYFTKTVKGKRDKKTNNILNTLQIFYSKIDSTGKWTVPQSAFTFNSSEYSIGQPSLSKDGKTIYFISDKPGGYGKTDIYYSVKQENGQWGNPVNAGKDVNTFGHELFPYISETGILFFSSNTHPGMGQLDIFRAMHENGKWGKVQNLKPPINSIGNDFGISYDGPYQRGFFSSDRFNGKGAEDIYSFSEEDGDVTFTFNNDSITFKDSRVFDDVKYKLLKDSNLREIELPLNNNTYSIKLKDTILYTLKAAKNGMPFNSIQFKISHDTIKKSYQINLSTEKIIHLNYRLSENIDQLELKETNNNQAATIVVEDETTAFKRYYSDDTGYFKIHDAFLPGKQYIIKSHPDELK